METTPHDFYAVPITITDWDALTNVKKHPQSPNAEVESSLHSEMENHLVEKQLGITETVEEIWNRISKAMKAKVREVLRRTDATANSMADSDYGDDARFLD